MDKHIKKVGDKFTQTVSNFLGSWIGVIFHSVWFLTWLVLDFDINVLTFSVSLEAIFIGIFLLMAGNKAEEKRDAREAKQRASDRERLEQDIKLDQKADRQLTEIKKLHKELHLEIKKLKKDINLIKSKIS